MSIGIGVILLKLAIGELVYLMISIAVMDRLNYPFELML